jgi:hypothetical protein
MPQTRTLDTSQHALLVSDLTVVYRMTLPVLRMFLDLHLIQYRFHVTVEIYVALQLIQKLALDGIFSDESVLPFVFRDHACPVLFHFCDAK